MNMTNNGNLRIIDSRIQNVRKTAFALTRPPPGRSGDHQHNHYGLWRDGMEVLANARVGVFSSQIFHSTGNGVNATGLGSATNLDDASSRTTLPEFGTPPALPGFDSIIANNSTDCL